MPVRQQVQDGAHQCHPHQGARLPVGVERGRGAIGVMLARHLHDHAGHRRHRDTDSQVRQRHHGGEGPVGHVGRERGQARQAHDRRQQDAAQQRGGYVPARRYAARDQVADGEHRQHGHQLDAGLQGVGAAGLLQEQAEQEQLAVRGEVDEKAHAVGRRKLRGLEQRARNDRLGVAPLAVYQQRGGEQEHERRAQDGQRVPSVGVALDQRKAER
ncbi:Uncharacterised protein [Achromobacter xylosoxidans]|nr:Uncharacterised protein [Achromobacter xylosoxidans]